MTTARVEYTPKEAAMLANACIASATASTPVSLRALVNNEERVLEIAKKAAGALVSERTVNKAIEEKIIRHHLRGAGRERRLVNDAAVFYLASFGLTELPLSKHAKSLLYKSISAWLDQKKHRAEERPAFKLSRHLVFAPGDDFREWYALVRGYAIKRSENIAVDPEIMGGVPVIKGTRVPVYTIHDLVERGSTIAQLRKDYPYVTEDAIVAAVLYARANPRAGRKKRFR